MFKEIESQDELPKLEKDILEFWRQNNIFKKSIEERDPTGNLYSTKARRPPTAVPVFTTYWQGHLKTLSADIKRCRDSA